MDSPSEAGDAPLNALRATLVAAHAATLTRAGADGGDDARSSGAVDAAPGRPGDMADADTERELANHGGGDLGAVEAVSVAAAVAAAHDVLVQEEATSGGLASNKASQVDGSEARDTAHDEERLAFNEATDFKGGASPGCRPVSGSSLKERGAAASDEAGTGTKNQAAPAVSSPVCEGDTKSKGGSAAASDEAGTGTKRKAADGLSNGDDVHGKKVKVKREAAAGAAVGATAADNDDDAGYLTAQQIEAAELALDKGYTVAQFEAAMKAVNDIGTVAAPLEAQLAHLQAVTIDDRTRDILMTSKLHFVLKHLWRTGKTYRCALRWAAACDTALDAINSDQVTALTSTAVASTRKAVPSLCKLCSSSLTTEWRAVSAPVGDTHKAGAASSVAASDGDDDDDIVVVGVTMAGDRAKLNLAQNKAESVDEPSEEKLGHAGEAV